MKKILFIFTILTASLSSFYIHVFSIEWLEKWIASQMHGMQVYTSWDVRYIAAITSLEYGIGVFLLYFLIREKLNKINKVLRSIILSLLLLAVQGSLFRQPVMDYVIGNPLYITLIQNGFKWIIWMIISFITVFGYEFSIKKEINS